FIVTDTGIGVAEENAQRIFIPFLKLDYYSEGLGIGLTLIRRGAELMGGTFILDPSYKEGARFILTLPL
ncbi:MAG: histidine kinase, partial [Bacteroidaceae bacterium]|nr:histidine kinase [Bacteroidaceae bacterium]